MESLFVYGKFCNQVARVESSENSEGGCIPVWDMKRPMAGKEKGEASLNRIISY